MSLCIVSLVSLLKIQHESQHDLDVVCPVQALLAARNSAVVVFTGTFGALTYVSQAW